MGISKPFGGEAAQLDTSKVQGGEGVGSERAGPKGRTWLLSGQTHKNVTVAQAAHV